MFAPSIVPTISPPFMTNLLKTRNVQHAARPVLHKATCTQTQTFLHCATSSSQAQPLRGGFRCISKHLGFLRGSRSEASGNAFVQNSILSMLLEVSAMRATATMLKAFVGGVCWAGMLSFRATARIILILQAPGASTSLSQAMPCQAGMYLGGAGMSRCGGGRAS